MKRILTLLGCLLISQFLTAQELTPQLKAKVQIARDYLKTKVLEWGIPPQEVPAWRVTNANTSKQSGVTHVYFTQTINGLEIYNAIVNVNITKEDKVLGVGNRSISNSGQKVINNKQSLMDPSKAIELAAKQLGYPWNNQLKLNAANRGNSGAVLYEDAAISTEPIPIKQMYFQTADGKLRLCWDMSFAEKSGKEWWSLRTDAFTGEILDKTNWVKTCGFSHVDHNDQCIEKREFTNIHLSEPKLEIGQSILAMPGTYRLYAFPIESNNFGSRTLLNPADDAASPFGWHDTDGAAGAEYTITRGNNVYAQLDDDADNGTFGYSPDGGAGLTFDFPINFANAPSTYVDASITNLFFANNFIHDFTHRYGFDEASGNFQANNYGNGGTGGDPVIADSQDASDVDNARFGTPAEGSSPRMSMYLFNGSPMRAGDLDNLVISHEFGHGVSSRLTGGPANVGCLDNDEQMGEGWSDWLGLMSTLEPGDQGTDTRGVGSYVFGLPITSTIRQTPYSTDMSVNPATYATAFSTVGPHALGYVWAGMLWDLSWALMDEYGQAIGFDLAMNMIIEGMKLQPCSPGFVDGRDGILAADQAITGGANYCLIWKVFARRGLGVSADQGSTADRADGTEAFDTPTSDYTLTSVPIAACYPNAAAASAAAAMAVSTEGTPLGTVTINTLVVGTCNATVTVTATDECLNSRTVQFNTIIDGADPIISSCPPNITLNVDADCEIVVGNYLPGFIASDNCSIASNTQNPIAGTTISGVGNSNVIFTVTDDCGRQSTCSMTITRKDVTPPTILCPADLTVALNASCQYILADYTGVVTTNDNCGIASTTQFPVIGTVYDSIGSSVLTVTTTDLSGNTASCSFTITREDQTPPLIDPLPTDLVLECNMNTNAAAIAAWLTNHGGASATDNCSTILTWAHDYNPAPSVACAAGATPVTFSVTDEYGNTSTASANIVINDTQPPVITYPAQGSTVFCNSDGQYLLDTWLRNHGNSVANDVCSGLAVAWTNNYYENLSNGCGNTGSKTVTFTATDICGNKSSTTATFTIIDVAAPVLTIPANITIACGASTLPANTGQATATDVCAGSPAESINIWINEFHYAQAGTDNNEFVEVAGPAGTNLNNATIYLYRSTDGKFYYTRFLSGIIPNQGNGKGTLSFSFPANTIQDGIAAIALVQGPLLMDFISYGGAFRATNGSAYGITSVNVGLTESNAGPNNVSIQRTGAGRLANTFTWTGPIPRTAGALNTGQTIAAPVTPTPGPTLSYTDTYNNPGPCNRIISRKWKATDDCGLASAEKIQLIKINFGNALVSSDNGELGSDADVQKEFADANGYFLHQNVPNPFNESTSILIESPNNQAAVMTVYNLAGKLIISEKIFLEKGDNTFEINADQLSGNGFYYYQIKTESWIDGKKMMHQQN